MAYRDHTKTVKIGDRVIGGGNPVLIQSMCSTKTEDAAATIAQIRELEAEGCDIIRVAVPTMEAALALRAALAGISSISRPNCLTIDECFGGVAAYNYNNVRELFNRITAIYDFVLDITHNELITDWHEQVVTVTKVDDISRIDEAKRLAM